jgi:hypothetical protein
VHAEIRTDINIKTALDNIYRLPQLGYCPTKTQEFCRSYQNENFQSEDYSTDDDDESAKSRDLANQVRKRRI